MAYPHHGTAVGKHSLPAGLVAPVRLTGLTPGGARTIVVTLPGVVTNLPAGDRVVLEVSTTDLAYQLPSSPRSYTIALAGGTVALATIDGRIIRAGQPWAWLLAGLAAMAFVVFGALLASARRGRRRSRTGLAELSGVPVMIDDLVKEYDDGYRAVDDVSFRVEQGQIVGLLGPNGSGKTTTLRVLMGLIQPTSGTVRVFCGLCEAGAPVLSRIWRFIE